VVFLVSSSSIILSSKTKNNRPSDSTVNRWDFSEKNIFFVACVLIFSGAGFCGNRYSSKGSGSPEDA